MMNKKEYANELHKKGYNCAQAVACTFAEELGVSEEILFKAMEGFGLGMGNTDATCGAVSGAVAVCGFKNSDGNLNKPATKGATYKLSGEVNKQFKEKNGSLVCKELKGIETGKVLRSCPDCIMDAVEIVENILNL